MSKKVKSQFPDTLYVNYEPEDAGEGYFVAEREPGFFAEVNARIRIGVYRLEKIADVSAEALVVDAD